MDPIRANELLDALIAQRPNVPGPEWQTVGELVTEAKRRGEKIGEHSMQTRLTALVNAGKAEQIRGPRRAHGTGWQFYYKLKAP